MLTMLLVYLLMKLSPSRIYTLSYPSRHAVVQFVNLSRGKEPDITRISYLNCSGDSGRLGRLVSLLLIIFHTCSIGDESGE